MADGTAHWRVRDTRCRYEVGDIIAKTTTPKDYEYLMKCDGSSFDTSKYTLLAKVFTDGKVPNLTDGRFLEGSTSSGTSISAGLPNITGDFKLRPNENNMSLVWTNNRSGAFSITEHVTGDSSVPVNTGSGNTAFSSVAFDASKSNSIYGASDTVQPKSFTVMYYVCYGG